MIGKINISIALCTYNGAKYLKEQLESIMQQTVLPDEMIICDDGSVDETLEIIEEFKKGVKFKLNIYHNEKTLGSTKNFEKAIKLCKEDIIVLCDQDDIWLPHKLEETKNVFISNPKAGYVFTNGILIDEKSNCLDKTLWSCLSFNKEEKDKFNASTLNQIKILFKRNVVTGATMAFRKNIVDNVLPISKDWIHDAWVAFFSSSIGYKGLLIDKNLIKYRVHKKQVCGIGGYNKNRFLNSIRRVLNSSSASYIKKTNLYLKILKQLNHNILFNSEINKHVLDGIKHFKTREYLHNNPRWKRVYYIVKKSSLGEYKKYSNGWRSVVKDLIF